MIPQSKFRVFAVDGSAKPQAGIPLALESEGRILGVMQTDHAGYASFAIPFDKAALPGDRPKRVSVYALAKPDARTELTADGAAGVLQVPATVAASAPPWLPSIAAADGVDRRTSPTSFASTTTASVGAGACETILRRAIEQ